MKAKLFFARVFFFCFLSALCIAGMSATVACDDGGEDSSDDDADDDLDDDVNDDVNDDLDDDVNDDVNDDLDDDADDDVNDDIDDDVDDDVDDDTYPTHDEIFIVHGRITVDGQSDVVAGFGLTAPAVYSAEMIFVNRADEEETKHQPTWDVDPGEDNYCVSLLQGNYDIWMTWTGYSNESFQWFRWEALWREDLAVTQDTELHLDHELFHVHGRVENQSGEDVEFQKVWLFTEPIISARGEESFEYYDYTDENGEYSITAPAGDYFYSVDVYDEGFDVLPHFEENLNVAADLEKNVTLQSPQDLPVSTFTYTVNGSAPPGPYDTFSGRVDLEDETHRVSYFDFCEGACSFHVPDGPYKLKISLDPAMETPPVFSLHYENAMEQPVDISGATAIGNWDIVLHTLNGVISDSALSPFPDVTISSEAEETARAGDLVGEWEAASDASGQYRVDAPAAAYDIKFDPPDGPEPPCKETQAGFVLSESTTLDYHFPEQYAELSGTVTINGESVEDYFDPFSEARVVLVDEDQYEVRSFIRDLITYQYAGLAPAGEYDVKLVFLGARADTLSAIEFLTISWPNFIEGFTLAADTPLDFDLELYLIEGVVSDWLGQPLESVTASFEDTESGLDARAVFAGAITDAQGEWSMWLPAGDYNLQFIPPECSGLVPLDFGEYTVLAADQIDFSFP